ncbi:MAG: hypothetical protein ACOYMN_23875, partial [Roseimicrobium sp.]
TSKPKKGTTTTYARGNVALRFKTGRPETHLRSFLASCYHHGIPQDEIHSMVDAAARDGLEHYVDKLLDVEVGEAFLTGDSVPPAAAPGASRKAAPAEPAGQGSCSTLDQTPSLERSPRSGKRSKSSPAKAKSASWRHLNPHRDEDFEVLRLMALGDLNDLGARMVYRAALIERKLRKLGIAEVRRK